MGMMARITPRMSMMKSSSSNSNVTTGSAPPRILTRSIARRNWYELERILSCGSVQVEIDDKGIITDESILHFALRYRAPLYIVQLLCLRYPQCLTRPDSTGKFPCHVAAKYGASPSVIEYLVANNKYAAGIQDPLGKTPIHYVAEFYPSYVTNESDENMLRVVKILREAAPQSFNLEDNEDRNAIEYAIENDAGLKIIKLMQRTARDDWRALKANGHGKTHQELEEDISRSAQLAHMNVVMDDISSSLRQQRRSAVLPARPPTSEDDKKSFTARSA